MPLIKKAKHVHFDLNEFKECHSPRKPDTLYLNVFQCHKDDPYKFVISLNKSKHVTYPNNRVRYTYIIKDMIYTGGKDTQDDFLKDIGSIFKKVNARYIKGIKDAIENKVMKKESIATLQEVYDGIQSKGGPIFIQGSIISFAPMIFHVDWFIKAIKTVNTPKGDFYEE
jgi:hypothetical protein